MNESFEKSYRRKSLEKIARDAMVLWIDWKRTAMHCHQAVNGTEEYDQWADRLLEYSKLAGNLAAAVGGLLPCQYKDAKFLSRTMHRISSPKFNKWDELEAELLAVEAAAKEAIDAL